MEDSTLIEALKAAGRTDQADQLRDRSLAKQLRGKRRPPPPATSKKTTSFLPVVWEVERAQHLAVPAIDDACPLALGGSPQAVNRDPNDRADGCARDVLPEEDRHVVDHRHVNGSAPSLLVRNRPQ